MIERGVLDLPRQIEIHLQFERFPIWLLALDSNLVSKVVILGASSHASFHENLQDRSYDVELVNAALDNVTRSKVTYSLDAPLPPSAILLVSGLLAFVKNWTRQVPNPMLLLCVEHVRSNRTGYRCSIQWMRLRHETFGGSTKFQAMLGSNIPDFDPQRTALRRTL
jgi:hypothetical protein